MPVVVRDFAKKRLTEQLKPGMRALVHFDRHGLGDMLMFQPLYQRLKQIHPEVEFHLKANSDQGYFDETPDAPVDIEFYIGFPETPGLFSKDRFYMSKPEACAVLELGIPYDPSLEFSWKPEKWNTDLKIKENCVGVVFTVDSDPTKGLIPAHGGIIWTRIKKAGFTPIEVVFRNPLHNPSNGRCAYVDYSCRDFDPSVENAIAVIKQCKGFVGVNTGTFCMATCLLDGHVLHLHRRHHFGDFYKRCNPVAEMDCTEPSKTNYKILDDYLSSCK